MLKKLKLIIAELLLKAKCKNNNSLQSFNEFFSKSEYIFVIMPEKVSYLASASELVRFLFGSNKDLTVIIKEDVSKMASLPERIKIIKYNELDYNYFGLPKKDFLNKLKIFKFELAIDLNITDSLFLYGVICSLNADIKVGFEKKDADLFYNLKLINTKEKPEQIYKTLIDTLKMFR